MKRARSIRLQPKLLLGLVAMAAVLAAILAPSIAQLYRARMEEQYASLAFGQASVAADLIDGDRVEQYYRTGEKDAYYEEIHRYLQDVREKLGLKYFYVVVPEDEVMYYIWDAGVPGEDGVCDLGDTDAYYGGGNELMHGAFAVDAEQTILITNNEEYGYLASAYVAILNKAGTPVALASVDISMDMIDQQIRQFLGLTLCVVLAVLLLSIFAYYYYVRRILIRPLRTLHHAAIGLVESRMEYLSHFRVEVNTGDELEELAKMVQSMALCGLGKSAPLPVLSTLRNFRDEYVEHIVDKKCAAHVCKAMRSYVIDPEKCKGCTKCARNCPVGAITGNKKEPHSIDTSKCIKCGTCLENCVFGAISVN